MSTTKSPLRLIQVAHALGRDVFPEYWHGTLLILRPARTGGKQSSKNLDLDGYYLTGDYSTSPPSIKCTKEPEKYSYWRIPSQKVDWIENINDQKQPAYLTVGNHAFAETRWKIWYGADNKPYQMQEINEKGEPTGEIQKLK